jgi:hypothetical protein
MGNTWSFWEDAVNAAADGNVEQGRLIIEPVRQSIETWIIETHKTSERLASAWLFLFGMAIAMLVVAAALNANLTALFLALVTLGAVVGYWYEKSRWRRLAKSINVSHVRL